MIISGVNNGIDTSARSGIITSASNGVRNGINTRYTSDKISNFKQWFKDRYGKYLTNFYDFNEGSGTTLTDRIGAKNGTLSGTVPGLPTWNNNKSLDFLYSGSAGDNCRVDLGAANGNPFNYNNLSNFTIFILYKTTQNTATNYILSNWNSAIAFGKIYINIASTGRIGFNISDNTAGGVGNNRKVATSLLKTNDGLYHTVFMTFIGGSTSNYMYAYNDGIIIRNTSDGIASGNFYDDGGAWSNKIILSGYYNGTNYTNGFNGNVWLLGNMSTIALPYEDITIIQNHFNKMSK